MQSLSQISEYDILWVTIYFSIILLFFRIFKSFFDGDSFYLKALSIKVLGGIIFSTVYIYVYGGGDAWAYYFTSEAISNILYFDFESWLEIFFGFLDPIEAFNRKVFNASTGKPAYYMLKDAYTFSVCKYSSIFAFMAPSYLSTTMLVSSFSFIGIWKLYILVKKMYDFKSNIILFIFFFTPSMLFWGSGIMKDTYVLSSCCWFVANLGFVLIFKKKVFVNMILLIFNLILITTIKPYITVCLVPSAFLWIVFYYFGTVKRVLLRLLLLPFLLLFSVTAIFFLRNQFDENLGKFSDYESAINHAQVIQNDLKREDQYGSNNYSIEYNGNSILSLISVSPIAVFTAIYRPMFWEVTSPIMIFSAIENTLLLIFTILALSKIKPNKFVKLIFKDGYLMFCISFCLIFSFGVGFASTNFGALVRYKIPLLPYLCSLFYIVNFKHNNQKHNI